ncbi:MAG TPA: type II toxin-antitoxin system HipA family toxin [Solirubrobacteraceae bacterium]|nr:type II toxin-antitoxin system HipA family toxin [Solirubrobacteraceae bacterium]
MSGEALAIWLNDLRVAVVERERRGRLRLSYTDEAFSSFQGGVPLLSLDLPLTRERYPNARTRAFLEGLLPEGEPRLAIAADLDLQASDVFGLLAALGRDCAGALVIQPAGDPPPATPTTASAAPIRPDELAQLVGNLRSAPLGVGRRVRLSLAGVQEKLLLTRMPDGGWGRPVEGAPSTHILKPEIARYRHTVENEAFCMGIARHLGLEVANVDVARVEERPVLVVERYDRLVENNGAVRRVHQEDLCQALGLSPAHKYEEDSGPTLARVAEVLRDFAEPTAIEALLRAVTLNVAIGNCDAHGKNFSLLHTDSGGLRLAPLYDLMATRLYPVDDHLAMYVDTVQRADRVTAERLVNEAAGWGMRRQRAEEIVGDLLERLPAALVAAAEETTDAPADLVALVGSRVDRLLDSRAPGGA